MPPDFDFPIFGTTTARLQSEVWIYLDPSAEGPNPNDGFYFANARRKPGVSLAQAQADAARVAADIARLSPGSRAMYTAAVVDLRQHTLNDLRSTLLLLFAAAGLLLVIACANVATLLLARSVARSRETAVRVALGAGRGHLALRYLAEAFAVSIVGAVVGVALSLVLVRAIVVAGSEYLPNIDELTIDWRVLAFGLGVALLPAHWPALRRSGRRCVRRRMLFSRRAFAHRQEVRSASCLRRSSWPRSRWRSRCSRSLSSWFRIFETWDASRRDWKQTVS
jgi:hypothetical protein